jgi:predicted GIY-YIG superfamily endonuclease
MIYLLHFDPPYKHAKHYLGYSADPVKRFERHKAGHGARLVKVAMAAGVKMVLVWVKSGNRKLERRLKGHSSTRICTVCTQK